jgi:hypothetical protein
MDLTRVAQNEVDLQNIERFVGGIIVEIEGSLKYYSTVPCGEQMDNVLAKLNGVRTISDYSIRRKAILDSIEIINRIQNKLQHDES